jgi:hypothetical protein
MGLLLQMVTPRVVLRIDSGFTLSRLDELLTVTLLLLLFHCLFAIIKSFRTTTKMNSDG